VRGLYEERGKKRRAYAAYTRREGSREEDM